MITLCLFIGYQPHICPDNLILAQNSSLLEIDYFNLLDFSEKISPYLVSKYTSQIIYFT